MGRGSVFLLPMNRDRRFDVSIPNTPGGVSIVYPDGHWRDTCGYERDASGNYVCPGIDEAITTGFRRKLTITGSDDQLRSIARSLMDSGVADMADSVYFDCNIWQMNATGNTVKTKSGLVMVCDYCGRQADDKEQACRGCGHRRFMEEWL